ncbi:MAG: glycosyltransferase family 4 protein [Gemmatimonadales bacterium]
MKTVEAPTANRAVGAGRNDGLHVCLTCIELFGFGMYGGFGRATRVIGRELVRRGVAVTVVVPRRRHDTSEPVEVDGMRVLRFDTRNPWSAIEIYRECDADVYHSQDTWLGTYLAMKAMPDRPHMITFRDPHDLADWKIETQNFAGSRIGWWKYRLSIDNPLVRSAVNNADSLYCAAQFLIPKVIRKYGLKSQPGFLPTPVAFPESVTKATRPTVCFVSRWDSRKKPEDFFALANQFPHVDFIAVGGSTDRERDRALREIAASIPNLELTGIIDQFSEDRLGRVLSKSWILVNASPREGLPNAFIEAAAHQCAILSRRNPDGFASGFGHHAADDDLAAGLRTLLQNDRWRTAGQRGYEYVAQTFEMTRALDAHLEAYELAMQKARA